MGSIKICDDSSYSKFRDKRLNLRLEKILSTLINQVECTIPQVFKEWSQIKGMYRFMSNKKVNVESITDAEFSKWSENNLSDHKVILAIQDTTELDLTGKRSSKQLGCLNYDKQHGLFLHNTLLCSGEGTPQVLFHQFFWSRNPTTLSKKKARKFLNIEQKESSRWVDGCKRVQQYFKNFPEKTVINICDREGDIYELLEMGNMDNNHYIVRSCNNRRVKDKDEKLWEQVKKESVHGTYNIEIKDTKTLQKRTATIQVRWLNNIVLSPPYRKSPIKLLPITVNMVYVEEINAPDGIEPVNWKLITSLKIKTFEKAITIISYYSYRWRIESFHHILKQGCKVEKLQLEQEHNLKNAIAIYSLIACKLLSMMYLSREKPQASINEIGFSREQYLLLSIYLEKRYNFKAKQQTETNPTIELFVEKVCILGGYLKHNKPNPGIKVLWRGMKELMVILNCFDLLQEIRCG